MTEPSEKIPEDQKGKAELKIEFIQLRAKGHTLRTIAKKLKVSTQTLVNWGEELEGEIATLKAIEFEKIYEQYHLLKEHRLKKLGNQLQKIRDELKNRDLSDIPTDKLLDFCLKYTEDVRKEFVDLKPLSNGDLSSLKNKFRTNLDSKQIMAEIYHTFLRFKLGLIDSSQANREMTLLNSMLKAEEQGEFQEKLEKLETIMIGGKK